MSCIIIILKIINSGAAKWSEGRGVESEGSVFTFLSDLL
jgi:hypothetical protein